MTALVVLLAAVAVPLATHVLRSGPADPSSSSRPRLHAFLVTPASGTPAGDGAARAVPSRLLAGAGTPQRGERPPGRRGGWVLSRSRGLLLVQFADGSVWQRTRGGRWSEVLLDRTDPLELADPVEPTPATTSSSAPTEAASPAHQSLAPALLAVEGVVSVEKLRGSRFLVHARFADPAPLRAAVPDATVAPAGVTHD